MLVYSVQDETPVVPGWNSIINHHTQPNVVCDMAKISLPPARLDVLKETLRTS